MSVSEIAIINKLKELKDKLYETETDDYNALFKTLETYLDDPNYSLPKQNTKLDTLIKNFNNIINSFNYFPIKKKEIASHLCSDLIYEIPELLSHYEFIIINSEFNSCCSDKELIEKFKKYLFYDENKNISSLDGLIHKFNNDNSSYIRIVLANYLFINCDFENTTKSYVDLDYKTYYYNKIYGDKYYDNSITEPRFYNKVKHLLLKYIHELIEKSI